MRKLRLKKRISKRKTFIIVVNIVLIIIGLLYPSIVDKSIISTKLTTYIESIINSKYALDSLIKTNLINNISETTIITIMTLLIVTFPISLIIYLTKPFSLGVSISSLIYIYKIKGILYAIIIFIPSILNLITLSILFYYSISYILVYIKNKNKLTKSKLLKEYIKVIIFVLILNIAISFIDSYISYYLFRLLK